MMKRTCLRRAFAKVALLSGVALIAGFCSASLQAQTFASIPALSFTKPFGGASPLPQVLTVGSTGADFQYFFGSSTATGGNWLTVSGNDGCGVYCTTPSILTVTANPAVSLAAGTYSGQVVVTSRSGSSVLTIPVTLTIAVPGGTFFDSLPGQVSFSMKTNGAAPPAQPIEVRNGGAGTLGWMLSASTADGGNWLNVSALSGTAPSRINISISKQNLPNSGLLAGSFIGHLAFQSSGGNVTVPVQVTVGDSVFYQVNPLNFTKPFGGANPLPQVITIASTGAELQYTTVVSTSTGGNWLTLTGNDGCGVYCSTPSVLTIGVSPIASLAFGTYTGQVTVFARGGAQSLVIPVSLTVAPPTVAFFDNTPGQFSFSLKTHGTVIPSQTFELRNSGANSLNWTASTSTADGGDWLNITAASGTTPSLATVSVTVGNLPNAGLVAGTFVGHVVFQGSGSTVTVPVQVKVGDSVINQINALDFTKPAAGDDPLPQVITIASTGADFQYTTAKFNGNGGNWLTLTGNDGCGVYCGTPSVFTVGISASAALPAGKYTAEVIVYARGGGQTMVVPVTLTVATPAVPFFDNLPGQLSFSTQPSASAPLTRTVQVRNKGAGSLDWTVSSYTADGGNWLSVSAPSGSGISNVTASVAPQSLPGLGLIPGTFIGGLVFRNGSSSVSIPVSVAVGASVPVQLSGLSFVKDVGGANPLSQVLNIASTGAQFQYTYAGSDANGQPWLTVTGNNGCGVYCVSPSTLTVGVNAGAALPAGIYTGQVVVYERPGVAAMTVPVTLTVGTQPPPPGPFDLLTPANGANPISLSPTLTWSTSSNATSYDVYFGPSPNPTFVANTPSTSYAASGLSFTTAYTWRVVAKNPAGSTPSTSTFSFTTTPRIQSTLTIATTPSFYSRSSSFTATAGDATPQSRTLTLTSTAGAGAYTSAVSGTPTFVTVSPASGTTTTATVTVTANPAGLAPGTYTNNITFSASGATAPYTVTLYVLAANQTPPAAKVGIFRASTGLFLVDRNGDGSCCSGDLIGFIGQTGDLPLSGDWTGDGVKKFGLYRPSSGLFLLDVNNNGSFDAGDKALFFAALPGDVPVVGDWTGTGVDRMGLFRGSNGTWYLDNRGDGSFVGRAFIGQAGDIPLVGNWNGVGRATKVGIYRPLSVNGQPGNFFLVDSNGDGVYTSADAPVFFFGQLGDIPLVGDWNGDGRTKVAVFRPAGSPGGAGLIVLDQNGSFSWDGPSTDRVLYFAPFLDGPNNVTTIQPGDMPVVGNWVPSYGSSNTLNLQGRQRVGVFRPSTGTFFLDVSADGTFQVQAFLGQSGDVPLGTPVISNGAVIAVY